jgi:hypothetical protein
MRFEQRFGRRSITAILVAALAVAGGLAATVLGGVEVGMVAVTEVSAFACLAAFTLLIWAAIQDGKPTKGLAH